MSDVISFVDYQPPPRYDTIPWSEARVQEGAASDGPWVQIDAVALSPLDSDPSAPALRSFTTSNGTADGLWYRIQFADANSSLSLPTAPIRNAPGPVYATVTELARILKIREPSSAQQRALERVLSAAASEINAEIDLASTDVLDGWQTDICAQVNLDRAADLWRHTESAPGILGAVDEMIPATPGRYSWERYAQRLSPIKAQWGLA